MSSHASLASQRPQSARTRLVGVIAAYASAADRRATTRRPRRGFFFISARRVAPPFSPGGVSREGTSSSTVVSNAERSNGAFRSRAPKSPATRSPETRAVHSGHRLDHPPAGGLVGDVRLGFEPEEKRQVRARQRRGALFSRGGGRFPSQRASRVRPRKNGGERFSQTRSRRRRRFPPETRAPRERQLPLRVGERARSSSAALGAAAAQCVSRSPKAFVARRAPARSSRRNAVRNARTSASSQRERSSARRAAASSRSSAETEPFFVFFVHPRIVFSRRLASERKRVVRVVLLRGDRGEVVHER